MLALLIQHGPQLLNNVHAVVLLVCFRVGFAGSHKVLQLLHVGVSIVVLDNFEEDADTNQQNL